MNIVIHYIQIEESDPVKKINIFLVLFILFAILTFVGAIYVLTSNGKASAGYAIIPSLFSVLFSQLGFHKQKQDQEEAQECKVGGTCCIQCLH